METTTPPSPTDRFQASSQALFERINNEGVILDMATETYFALNETGTCVWEAVANGGTFEGAALRLADRFSIPLEKARTDTQSLVHELLQRHLVEPSL